MNKTSNVIQDVRGFLHLDATSNVFDAELIPHILSTLGKLSQNGVGVTKMVDESTTWTDIINPDMVDNEAIFTLVPLFVMLNVKILFDPPPPSAIEYHKQNIEELLWRLRLEYDVGGGEQDERAR